MMRLSDACDQASCNATIVRDCEFEELYLVGKPFPLGKKTISFLGAKKFIDGFLDYEIDGVLCTNEIAEELVSKYKGGIAVVENPKTAFFGIHNYYAGKRVPQENRIDSSAVIHPTAIIEDHDVVIGKNTVIMAHAVIKSGSRIGNDCVLHEGCVIGSPAFYYYGTGKNKKLVTSTGTAVLGDNVELQTYVTVEKSVLGGSTRLGDNTKIDNLCLIGHDSQIGKNVTIAAGSTLAGGVELGDDCFLGVGVTISPYVKCGSRTKLSSGAVVTKEVPADTQASGNFAIPHDKFIRHIKNISR